MMTTKKDIMKYEFVVQQAVVVEVNVTVEADCFEKAHCKAITRECMDDYTYDLSAVPNNPDAVDYINMNYIGKPRVLVVTEGYEELGEGKWKTHKGEKSKELKQQWLPCLLHPECCCERLRQR